MHRGLAIGAGAALGLVLAGGGWLYVRAHRDPLQTARTLMDHGDLYRAGFYLREAVRQQPHNAEAAWRLGIVDLAGGQAAAAELELKRARQYGYDMRALLLPLGQSYLQQRQYDQLLADIDPAALPAAVRGDALALRSAAELGLGHADAALKDAQDGQAQAPQSPEPLLAAARADLSRGDEDAALASVQRVLDHNPHQGDALLLRAALSLNHGHPEAAMADAQTMLADNPGRPDARLMTVRAQASMGQEKEARATVEDVLRRAPRDVNANYLRMVLAIRAQDWHAAGASLDVISPNVGSLPRGLYYTGVVRMSQGQPAQAEEAVGKFLATHPEDREARRLMAFIELARRRPAEARAQLADIVAGGHADADTLDLMGRAQAMLGDRTAALRSFTDAQARAPGNEQILNRLAAVRLSLGDTGAAEGELRHSLALSPNQPMAGEALVRSTLNRGDIAGARSLLAEQRKALGDTEAFGVLEADIALADYDLPRARDGLEAVLKRFPDSGLATLHLARVLGAQGDLASARRLLTERLARHPADAPALDLLVPALLADPAGADQAIALAEAAHAAQPDSVQITALLAGTYLRAQHPDRALALLDRAGAVSSDPGLLLLRARTLATLHRGDAARDAYRDLLEVEPGAAEARRELAALRVEAHDEAGARSLLRDGLRASPGNPVLLGSLVGITVRASGPQAALAEAAALAADPAQLPAARLLAGDIWAAQGDQARAADAYAAAFRATPSTPLVLYAAAAYLGAHQPAAAQSLLAGWLTGHPDDQDALAALAAVELSAKQIPQARAHLEKLIALNPLNAGALNNLAWALAQGGDLAAATPLAKRAYYLAPQPNVADTLGWILVRDRQPALAAPLLLAASTATGAPDMLYHYAAALADAGRPAEAKPILARAIAAKTEYDERADAERLAAKLGG